LRPRSIIRRMPSLSSGPHLLTHSHSPSSAR
jgi:hypothetical protein